VSFKVFKNLFELIVIIANEEKGRCSVKVWDTGIDSYSVLDLNLTEVVHFSYPLLNCGRMSHADESLLDINYLELGVEKVKHFLKFFQLQVNCSLIVKDLFTFPDSRDVNLYYWFLVWKTISRARSWKAFKLSDLKLLRGDLIKAVIWSQTLLRARSSFLELTLHNLLRLLLEG